MEVPFDECLVVRRIAKESVVSSPRLPGADVLFKVVASYGRNVRQSSYIFGGCTDAGLRMAGPSAELFRRHSRRALERTKERDTRPKAGDVCDRVDG